MKTSTFTVSRVSPWSIIAILVEVIVMVLVFGFVMLKSAAQSAQNDAQKFGFVLTGPGAIYPAPKNPGVNGLSQVSSAEDAMHFRLLPEVQPEVPFVIPQPGWLPDGVSLQGVMTGSGSTADGRSAPIQVIERFGPDAQHSGLFLLLQVFSQPAIRGGVAVPATQVLDRQVGGRPAAFAQGAWDDAGQWVAAGDQMLLSWSDDHYTYILSMSGAQKSADSLIKIADSIH